MELEHLREFVVLAKTLSFARTAEQLFTTQPTISKHLKALEAELGVPLFYRTSRQVALNEHGALFLPYAKRMMQTQYEYKTAFYNQIETKKVTLSIGSIPVMAQYQITDIIVKFKQENRNFKINVIEGDTDELKLALLEDRCELAFIRDGNNLKANNQLGVISYYTDTLIALLPINHSKALQKSIKLEDLSKEDFILMKEKTFLYELCINACDNAGFSPNVVFTGHRMENIMDLVAKKMGVALLMKCQTLHYPTGQLSLIPIEPPIESHINLVYKKNRKLSLAATHFINCVKHV